MENKVVALNYPISYINHVLQNAPFFKPTQKGQRAADLVVQHKYTSGDSITIFMPHQLDIKDEDLFLSILAITYITFRGTVIDSNSKLYKDLNSNFEEMKSIKITTTRYELLKELNINPQSSTSTKWVETSLNRLKSTKFILNTNKFDSEYMSRLISLNIINTTSKTKKIEIALNTYICSYFLQDNILKSGIISHNRQERMSLKKEIARALHSYFNALVNVKKSRLFNINTLVEKLYQVDINTINKYNKSKKRKSIKDGLVEINNLELWEIDFIASDLVKIIRK